MPWDTMRDFLHSKLHPVRSEIDEMLRNGEFVDAEGLPWHGDEAYRPHTFVWFHRRLREEPPVPGELRVLFRDERLVVFDKPHFLSSIPRGRHVRQSAVVWARQQLDLPELSVAHRLDRGTAGVLLMTTARRWRAAYQQLFAARQVTKTYRVIAPFDPCLKFPLTVESRLIKEVGSLQATTVPGPANAHTRIELAEVRGTWAAYTARPLTGKTHQIRAHFNQLGIPILGDPLYPQIKDVDIDDFSTPLRLLAHTLSFKDPVDQQHHCFVSEQTLTWPK